MAKYRVLKLLAEKILMYNKINGKSGNGYEMDLDQPEIYDSVVDEELRMESCALFDQFCFELGVNVVGDEISDILIHKFVIVDFSSIYKQNPIPKEEAVRFLIEHGFTLCHKQEKIHFVAFDKSGNMSRKCRLSFISSEYLEAMNRRLNLDMHFGKVKLNKYYAYRGLYLSTAKRVDDSEFEITPETLVIVDDQINKEYAPYQKDVLLYEGKLQKNHSVVFQNRIAKFQDIDVPYDGQGIVSPSFANRMVQSLGGEERNSFQIRLPFVKGMLHRVEFHGFLAEYASGWNGNGSYTIPDAFGINRDLKKAQIIMTKSMFKCFSWLVAQGKVTECDPMQFYCDKLKAYGHALYVSATDLPYGKSLVTHTSYQLLNTLALSEEQFQALIDENLAYASNPITYLKKTHGYCVEEDETNCGYSNWQRAVILNPAFAKLPYIKQKLTNIQTAIMTKIALGKLIVSGQTRFIARDLLSMVINLIASEETKADLLKNKIFSYRFYMPQGMEGEQPRNPMKLEYEKYCGFYRSPHLSRNEQVLLAPITGNWAKMLHKYFAHLTGIVMVGNESIEPMALGGADFDGDLVSVITNENVVNAIKESNYTLSSASDKPLDINRKENMPYICILSMTEDEKEILATIPYEQIKDTFSNRIGLISNASIAIGQVQYGTKKDVITNLKCEDCTILTGLEIDAAKNGVHPDLSKLLVNEQIQTCGYLEFKKKFERLRKSAGYHFNQLVCEKKDGKYSLKLKGTTDEFTYEAEEGTYINQLPIVFMEHLDIKLKLPKTSKKMFQFGSTEINKDFQEQCQRILDAYTYYKGLYDFVRDESCKKDYSESNLKGMLVRQYDSEQVEKILAKEVPEMLQALAISSHEDRKEWEKQINESRWMFMNREEKKVFLKKRIKDFEETTWEIVLNPYLHGYKILFYLVGIAGQNLNPKYDVKKKQYDEKSKGLSLAIIPEMEERIEEFYNYKLTGVPTEIFKICLSKLKKVVCTSKLSTEEKIFNLFELTKKEKNKAQFFWECFAWEELEPYIVKCLEEEETHAE